MTEPFKVACVQMTSVVDPDATVAAASDLVRRARDAGAALIALPENAGRMAPQKVLLAEAEEEAAHRGLAAYRAVAAETGAWLLVGSLTVRLAADRLANRSYLIAGDGTVAARYDKIHMFDVDLPSGEQYRESAAFRPGGAARLADTPWGTLGMTVCYDLRFPALYRALAQAGADFIAVPSAFTRPTGAAHWHVLLRARAIETGCFVFAPAQCGSHYGRRATYGHSLIVAPWGEVLAEAEEEPGVILADVNPAAIAAARTAVPSLQHDRPFAAPESARRAAAE